MDKIGLTIEEQAEAHEEILKQLGYIRINTGRWIEELQDDGQGFPQPIYTCPFCSYVSYERTNYCSKCGARLKEYETD